MSKTIFEGIKPVHNSHKIIENDIIRMLKRKFDSVEVVYINEKKMARVITEKGEEFTVDLDEQVQLACSNFTTYNIQDIWDALRKEEESMLKEALEYYKDIAAKDEDDMDSVYARIAAAAIEEKLANQK